MEVNLDLSITREVIHKPVLLLTESLHLYMQDPEKDPEKEGNPR